MPERDVGKPAAATARLRDKQPHYADMDEVSRDALEAGVKGRPKATACAADDEE